MPKLPVKVILLSLEGGVAPINWLYPLNKALSEFSLYQVEESDLVTVPYSRPFIIDTLCRDFGLDHSDVSYFTQLWDKFLEQEIDVFTPENKLVDSVRVLARQKAYFCSYTALPPHLSKRLVSRTGVEGLCGYVHSVESSSPEELINTLTVTYRCSAKDILVLDSNKGFTSEACAVGVKNTSQLLPWSKLRLFF